MEENLVHLQIFELLIVLFLPSFLTIVSAHLRYMLQELHHHRDHTLAERQGDKAGAAAYRKRAQMAQAAARAPAAVRH